MPRPRGTPRWPPPARSARPTRSCAQAYGEPPTPAPAPGRSSEEGRDAGADVRGEVVDGTRGVEHEESLGFRLRECQVAVSHARMELGLLGLESVEAGAGLVEPRAADALVEVEEDCEIGQEALRGPQGDVAHLAAVEHAAGALVGH